MSDILADLVPYRLSKADRLLLLEPEAQAVIVRVAGAVDPESPYRLDHVRRVACIAVRAKRNPTNKFAVPTL